MSEIPERWQDLMDRAGYTSLNKLSDACGGNPTTKTVADIVLRGKRGSDESVAKIAEALGVTVAHLNGMRTGYQEEPLRIPAGTEKLNATEKEAVQVIIRALVKTKELPYVRVDEKKTAGPAEQAPEKTNVTPLVGRRMTPAQRKFEVTGRKVAKTKRDIPQGKPKIGTVSPEDGE